MGVALREDENIATVVLNWPQSRNSLDPARAREVLDTLTGLRERPHLRGVVVTGEGAFCSGGDLKYFLDQARRHQRGEPVDSELHAAIYATYQGIVRCLLSLQAPTVAAVDGPAIGLGMDLALACDICLIGPSGWLMQGWGRMGLIPGTGGTLLLSRRIGQQQAWRTLVDSERIKPDRAERLGIGSAVWGTSAAEEAVQLLRRFDVLPTSALRRYVQLMRQPLASALEPHLSDCLSAQLELLTGPDFLDRAEAALAGREPGRRRT